MHFAIGSGLNGRGLEGIGMVQLARVLWAIGSSLFSPAQLTATVGGTMSTPGNGSAGVRLVCTLGVCTGGRRRRTNAGGVISLGSCGCHGLRVFCGCSMTVVESRDRHGPPPKNITEGNNSPDACDVFHDRHGPVKDELAE